MNGLDGLASPHKLRKHVALPLQTAGKSHRLPTYVDYSTSKARLSDADDKHKKYKSGWTANVHGKARNLSGWPGALLRYLIRAGASKKQFWKKTVLLAFVGLLLFLLYFNYTYYTYIELAFFRRGWIQQSIMPVPPLSGTCFRRENIASSRYNQTLAASPNYLSLSPGIPMRFGLDCYHFSKQLPSIPFAGQELPEHVIYHLYWRADLAPLSRRQILLLKSVLATQDPDHSSVILWTNDFRLAHNALLTPVLAGARGRLNIRVIDSHELASDTPMENHQLLNANAVGTVDHRAWVDGDLVRVLVLYRFGGVWIDMDTLILRDFRPLFEQEWVTQWDCYDKPYIVLNGAVMHFYAHSPYLCEMLHIMATGPAPRPASTDWGSLLYHQLHRRLLQAGVKPFSILPYCLTDARNCRLDNRLADPFLADDAWISSKEGRRELEMKLDSIFSIHLHNQWQKTFPAGGWVETLVIPRIEQAWERFIDEHANV